MTDTLSEEEPLDRVVEPALSMPWRLAREVEGALREPPRQLYRRLRRKLAATERLAEKWAGLTHRYAKWLDAAERRAEVAEAELRQRREDNPFVVSNSMRAVLSQYPPDMTVGEVLGLPDGSGRSIEELSMVYTFELVYDE